MLVTAVVAAISLLFAGAALTYGKRIPAIAIIVPVLLPPLVGLTSAGYRLVNLQTTAESLTRLQSRIGLFAKGVEEVDAARLTGILIGGLFALVLGFLASFHGLTMSSASPPEKRALSISAIAASAIGIFAWLFWHSSRSGWPSRFDWLAVGAVISGAVAAAAPAVRGADHAGAHRLAAFAFSGSAYLFGLAEYAVRRDRALGALPGIPFLSSHTYLTDIASLPRPDAWAPRVDAALVLAIFFVPLLRASRADDAERRGRRRGIAGGALTLAAMALALGAFDRRVANGVARQTAPLTRFQHIDDASASIARGDIIELGPALFVTRHGKVFYDAGAGEAPPVPLTAGTKIDAELLTLDHVPRQREPGDNVISHDMLLYADRRLSLVELLDALAPVRDRRGVKVQLVLEPTVSARDASFTALQDAFAGELSARTVVITEHFDDALAWLRGDQRLPVTVLFTSNSIVGVNGTKNTSLPFGDSPMDHKRRQEYYGEIVAQSFAPMAILIVVAPDQRLEEISTLLLDLDTVLAPARQYGQTTSLAPLVLSSDRRGFDANTSVEAKRTLAADATPWVEIPRELVIVRGPLTSEDVDNGRALSRSVTGNCLKSGSGGSFSYPKKASLTLRIAASGEVVSATFSGVGSPDLEGCLVKWFEKVRWAARGAPSTVSATIQFYSPRLPDYNTERRRMLESVTP